MREQDLRSQQIVPAKTLFVGLHQPHLTNSRSSLQLMHGAGALLPAQPLHALGDSAAGHQHHFAIHLAQLDDLFSPARERSVIQPLPLIGHQTGADLDHEAARGFQR